MSWSSTVPLAMTALVTRFSVIPLNGEVRDGPQLGDSAAREVITVGYIGPEDDTATDVALTKADLGAGQQEAYQIHCAIAVQAGDEDVAATRTRAFEIFSACGAVVQNNGTLGGVVASADMGSWTLRQDETTGGMYCRIRFDVEITGFTGH